MLFRRFERSRSDDRTTVEVVEIGQGAGFEFVL
jgi:hypothetical protein